MISKDTNKLFYNTYQYLNTPLQGGASKLYAFILSHM